MKVVQLNKTVCLTTQSYDPNPTRFRPEEVPVSERRLPLVFKCDQCDTEIAFKTSDLEKHCDSDFTNLSDDQSKQFASFVADNDLNDLSFLDFNCPHCNRAVMILFRCGPSGFWGEFSFEIESVLVLNA